jgi:hypothetical protein
MASTYSDLKIELIGTGEQSGTWGNTTNINLGIALGEAITGTADVPFSSADVTLTLTNTNTSQTARNLRLNLTGTSGGARNLTVPNIEKFYIISNSLADEVTVKNTTGSTYIVPAGTTAQVFSSGAGIKDAISFFAGEVLSNAAYIGGGEIDATPIGGSTAAAGSFTTLAASGSLTVDGNTTLGNASGDTITANAGTMSVPNNLYFSGTGTIRLPNGTTGERPTPADGMIRYNVTTSGFEGYAGGAWGSIGGGATGGGGDQVFYENELNVTTSYTLTTNRNAMSTGPITIDAGAVVTIPSGQRWVIL